MPLWQVVHTFPGGDQGTRGKKKRRHGSRLAAPSLFPSIHKICSVVVFPRLTLRVPVTLLEPDYLGSSMTAEAVNVKMN
jgi:hypothetical protein